MRRFEEQLALLPGKPGCYRMYNQAGELLYVGKAKNLKNRVRNYFQKNTYQLAPRVRMMVSQVERFDYVVTDSEIEALILEANLIKTNLPKYNVLLKDDKRFPWIALSDEKYPRLYITRNPEKRGKTKYFGPYTSSGDMYATLQVIRKVFPLRQRRKPLFKNRPCMNYFIGTCPGLCQELITPEDYAKTIRQVELFLKGKTDDLLENLMTEMASASDQLQFERAAKLRDRYQAVVKVAERQKMMTNDTRVNQDMIACASDGLSLSFVVMNIRKGKLISSQPYSYSMVNETTLEEAYSTFVYDFYESQEKENYPEEVILQFEIEEESMLQEWLSQGIQKKALLTYPQRGTKKDLLQLALKNAKEFLEKSKLMEASRLQNDPTQALLELQESLNLSDFPSRMECYDISHFQGSHTVASMVVFVDGRPAKKEYRRFKIKTAEGKPDDFKSMYEVISRRFAHSQVEDGWDDPDLVIIDGGKGQLSMAVQALQSIDIADQDIISLAKKFEEVYIPGRERPILLSRQSKALFLLQQIRDEAHRFAITYHRSLRAKAATQSELDTIKGIGTKRKQQLFDVFGSVDKIKAASVSELAQAISSTPKMGQKLYDAIHQTALPSTENPTQVAVD